MSPADSTSPPQSASPADSARVEASADPHAAPPLSTPPVSFWRRCGRAAGWSLLNLWLVYHLLAVVIAPLSVPPTSSIYQNAWSAVGPYVAALYINHGYHFFAPEPNGATLLGYTLEFADGRVESGRIPNLGIQPRLLYHRHFMLTEQMQNFDSDDLDPKLQEKWCRTYALALGRDHGAAKVTLSRVRHMLPTMERIRAGGKLDDGNLYIEEPLGTWECAAR